jgi:hypothetical protein
VQLEEKKALSAVSLPAPKTRLEEEILELQNFVTVLNDGRENHETRWGHEKRSCGHVGIKGAPSGGIEMVLRMSELMEKWTTVRIDDIK